MPKPTSRDIVFRTLSRWIQLQDPPFLPERHHPDWAILSARDRAFAYDLLTGILRWRGTLEAVISSRLNQPFDTLEMGLRVALWLGTYQLLFQGTADYAAVNTAVDLARKINPRGAGLVNAVLRAITRLEPRRIAATASGDAAAQNALRLGRHLLALDFDTNVRFNTAIFADPARDMVAHLAAVRSHPAPFVAHFLKIYPDQASAILLRNNLRPTITLRVDADQLDVPAVAGLTVHAGEPRFLVAAEGWSDVLEQLVDSGKVSPQDPTAARPIRRVAELVAQNALGAPARILDLCAGLGTKTVQLARTFPAARITATDLDNEKLHRLHARTEKLKLSNVQTLPLPEIENLKLQIENRFDLILLDVPCSNTGVFAKRVQSRWRWPMLDHAALAAMQLKLLEQAAALLAPAGTILYSTCSIDPAENQERVGTFVSQNPTFSRRAEEFRLPALPSAAAAPHDGGYFALLRREGGKSQATP
jgi:16S rRNA (cytosine967-C5)-methyltransferase